MAGLTAKHLYDELKKIVESGKGDSKVFFDSEAVCFETHLVEIEGVSFDSDEETGLGDRVTLHWSMQTQPFFHFTAKMKDKLLSPTCGIEQRKFLDEVEKGDWHDTGDDDPEFRIEGIMVGQETFLFRKDFQADLQKVIQGQ